MRSSFLSTDARFLVIKLGGHCNIVDFALSSVARSIGVSRYTCKTESNLVQICAKQVAAVDEL